jgi:hypothetical protein
MRWRALRFMTRNSDSQSDSMAPLHCKAPRSEAEIDIRARIGVRTAAVVPVCDRVREPRLSEFLYLDASGEMAWDTLQHFSYFHLELPQAMPPHSSTNSD